MAQLKRILIVDDDTSFLNMLESKLYFANYEVLKAKGGEEAFKMASAEPIDLIIMDIKMPDADGFEVSIRLKKDERTKDIPIFFISGLQDNDDSEKALSEPARPNMIFAKSIPTQALITKIRQILGEE